MDYAHIRGNFCLRYVAADYVPPADSWLRTFREIVDPLESNYVGWWGDQQMRTARINDWHFSDAAVAWYVGMHRMALNYLKYALTDSSENRLNYISIALHFEANALHALTDLFSFGHTVVDRGNTSREFLRSNYPNLDHDLIKWMNRMIEYGEGARCVGDFVKMSRRPALTRINSIGTVSKNTLLTRPHWTYRALFSGMSEVSHHDSYNQSQENPVNVMNLKGEEFQLTGDGRLNELSEHNVSPLVEAIRESFSSLHSALQKFWNLRDNPTRIEEEYEKLDRSGSEFFLALRNIPIFIISAEGKITYKIPLLKKNYSIKGRYMNYAEQVSFFVNGFDSNASLVKFNQCKVGNLTYYTDQSKCTEWEIAGQIQQFDGCRFEKNQQARRNNSEI